MIFFPSFPKVKTESIFEFYPMTLTLVFLNLFFYMVLKEPTKESAAFPKMTQREDVLKQQGEYEVFMLQTTRFYLEWKKDNTLILTESELMNLSRSALVSQSFESALKDWQSNVDLAAFQIWKKTYDQLKSESKVSPSQIFGLSHQNKKSLSWFTYQFVQYDAVHILMNLVPLIFFAAYLESLVGAALLGFIYLLGGLAGGWAYLWWGVDNSLPLVGASASISALIGFAGIGSSKKRIPFITVVHFLGWLLQSTGTKTAPTLRWTEDIHFSPYWILAYFLLGDISVLLSTPSNWSDPVSHVAHVGGGVMGIFLGLAYRVIQNKSLFTRSKTST